jgi:hypothetical protein
MNINWGTGIAIFFSVFALGMTGMVMASRKYPPNMVQKNYYDLDLNYQDRLDRKQNPATLATKPVVQYDPAAQVFRIVFPENMIAAQGTAKFYQLSTDAYDFTTKIENTAVAEVPAQSLTGGRWHTDIEWESAGKKYYYETSFSK